jgi:hypothetical protein
MSIAETLADCYALVKQQDKQERKIFRPRENRLVVGNPRRPVTRSRRDRFILATVGELHYMVMKNVS